MNPLLVEAPSVLVWVASFITVFLSLIVLISANPVASAVALMGTLFSSAALYFALGNYFMGSVQILVYAGAIAVLFVFIVMLLDLRPSLLRFVPGRKLYIVTSCAAGTLLGFYLLRAISSEKAFANSAGINPDFQLKPTEIAEYFVSNYQVAFQSAGLLVFGAILGAVVLARSHLGKEVAPRSDR